LPVLPPSTLWLAEPGSQHWEGREEGGGKTLKPGPTFPKEGLGRVADGVFTTLPAWPHWPGLHLPCQNCPRIPGTQRTSPAHKGRGAEGPIPPDASPKDQQAEPMEGMGRGRQGRMTLRVLRRCSLPPYSILKQRSQRSCPVPADSPGCCGGPWSPATCGPRGLWWTHPGCACTPWGRGGAELLIPDAPMGLCLQQTPREEHD
jgi:hypothetical protein